MLQIAGWPRPGRLLWTPGRLLGRAARVELGVYRMLLDTIRASTFSREKKKLDKLRNSATGERGGKTNPNQKSGAPRVLLS